MIKSGIVGKKKIKINILIETVLFLVGLGFELKASHLQSRCSTA
jgi:hypothetical protein